MTWIDIALWAALFVGVAAAGFIYARRPAFWIEAAGIIFKKLWPYLAAYVLKRMSAEDEVRMRACIRSGGKWNNVKKRCE